MNMTYFDTGIKVSTSDLLNTYVRFCVSPDFQLFSFNMLKTMSLI